LMGNLVAAQNIPVSADGSLTFTVPQNLAPDCAAGEMCAQFLMLTSPKGYSISIESRAHDPSSTLEGTFFVTTSAAPAL